MENSRSNNDQVGTTKAPADGAEQRSELASASLFGLVVGSVGVVYGDIGTSPLYAFRTAVEAAQSAGIAHQASVLGVLSLILWSLLIIVTGKYVLLLLNADNHGEGGTFALMALAQSAFGRYAGTLTVIGMVGVAFFFGDAVITPAISVLSAVEGLAVAAPGLHGAIIPIAVVILTLLFAAQPFGTARVAGFFGPVMLIWFSALALGGAVHIIDNPGVLQALWPGHAVSFLVSNGLAGFFIMGLVFLAVTGAEALYADLGHFGRTPIRIAWLVVVLPALVLNYFGQGAMVLAEPAKLDHPFYNLYPQWAIGPMVGMAMLATIIASQAVITGAFSLVSQAVRLNLLPRLKIAHTSAHMRGQIYVPQVNWLLYVAVLFVTVFFGSSTHLAAAYGISVAADMIFGSLLAMFALAGLWRRPLRFTVLMMLPFLALELTFFSANSSKLLEGAWLPVLIAFGLILIMWSWTSGAKLMFAATRRNSVTLDWFTAHMPEETAAVVPGTAVFFSADADLTPVALQHNIEHNKIMHEHNFVFSFVTEDRPFVPPLERIEVEPVDKDGRITRIIAHYGFMQSPRVPLLLPLVRAKAIDIDPDTASFFVSKRSVYTTRETAMPSWQKPIFTWLHEHAQSAGDYYRIPREQMIEIGTQLAI